MFPKIRDPKSSILIGFGTIIFTIHFGGFPPICGLTPRWILCCLGLLGLLCILALLLQLAGGDWNRPLNLGLSTKSQPEVLVKTYGVGFFVRHWQTQIVWNQKKPEENDTAMVNMLFLVAERCLNFDCLFIECQLGIENFSGRFAGSIPSIEAVCLAY